MKKRYLLYLCISLASVLFLTSCISGELLFPDQLLEITECTRYVDFDPETVTDWWEEDTPTSVPDITELEEASMDMRTYRKIVMEFKSGAQQTDLTCIKFDIEADIDCSIYIVIRDEDDIAKEPIFDRVFHLTAGEPESVIIADFIFTNGDKLVIYNECPEDVEPVDYDAFFANWRIEWLQIVGEYK